MRFLSLSCVTKKELKAPVRTLRIDMLARMERRGTGLQATSATLKALSHPVRLKLIDALVEGPMTATELAQVISETSTTCSFHLRQLEKYGLIGLHEVGPGRRRSWKLIHRDIKILPNSMDDEYREASTVAFEVMLQSHIAKISNAIHNYHEEPLKWQRSIIGNTSNFYLTAEELSQVSREIDALISNYVDRWGSRSSDSRRRPSEARRLELSIFGVPIYSDRA